MERRIYLKKNIQIFAYYTSLDFNSNTPLLKFSNEDELNSWLLRLIPNKQIDIINPTILNFVNKLPVYSKNDHSTVYADFITKNLQYINTDFDCIYNIMKNDLQYGYFVINNPQLLPNNVKTHIMDNTFNIITNLDLLMEIKEINNNNGSNLGGFKEYIANK